MVAPVKPASGVKVAVPPASMRQVPWPCTSSTVSSSVAAGEVNRRLLGTSGAEASPGRSLPRGVRVTGTPDVVLAASSTAVGVIGVTVTVTVDVAGLPIWSRTR